MNAKREIVALAILLGVSVGELEAAREVFVQDIKAQEVRK